jgi:hypothetical protein
MGAATSHARTRVDPLCVFAFLWACQSLIHQEFYQQWLRAGMWSGWLLTLLSFWVLLRPRGLAGLAMLASFSFAHGVARWPFVKNHILVESLFNLAILAAIAWTSLQCWHRTRRSPLRADLGVSAEADRETLFQRFTPVLRVGLIAIYAFAAFAKLNSDFLEAEGSCATALYGDLLGRFPFLPDGEWVHLLAIWGTVAFEAAIPLLLAFHRTRAAAILIGLPFHLMLGLIGHWTFSGMVYTLYFLFISEKFTAVVNWMLARLESRRGAKLLPRSALVLALLVLANFVAKATDYDQWFFGSFGNIRLGLEIWLGWSLCIGAIYLAALSYPNPGGVPASASDTTRAAGAGPLWFIVVLLVLNGCAPYLGLKTATSFTMYSNLRTEGDRWNHLLAPPDLKRWTYQDDLVEILETNHLTLRRYAETQHSLTWFELRRAVSGAEEDFWVTYRRGDDWRRFELKNGRPTDPQLWRPHPLLLDKLLSFRSVPRQGTKVCQW